jgi:hypothetical protein
MPFNVFWQDSGTVHYTRHNLQRVLNVAKKSDCPDTLQDPDPTGHDEQHQAVRGEFRASHQTAEQGHVVGEQAQVQSQAPKGNIVRRLDP